LTSKRFSASYTYDPVGNIRTLKRYDKNGNLLDDLTYHYYDTLRNNRLEYITDAVSSFTYDLGTQSPGNYQYDSVGNMISDASRVLAVEYNYSNKPRKLIVDNKAIKFLYNPFGDRFFNGALNQDGDVFLYNSQGQLVAKYRVSGDVLKLNYLPIYEGTKRIGIVESEGVSWLDCPELMLCGLVAIDPCMLMVEGQPKPPCKKDSSFKADRKYELVGHLGNVRVVIANQRIPVDANGDSLVDYYKPLVKEISDYYPYGWVKFHMNYSFGANAGSLFEEWDSSRGTYYTVHRFLDARLVRWYQVDPKWGVNISESPYVVNRGNPVNAVDPEGDVPVETIIDIGFLLYDLGVAGYEFITEGEVSEETWVNVGLSAAGVLIPYVPSAALRSGRAISKAMREVKAVGEAVDLGIHYLRALDRAFLLSKNVSKIRIIGPKSASSGRVIVIGETMKGRVRGVAEKLGAETFDDVQFLAKKEGISIEEAREKIQDNWDRLMEEYADDIIEINGQKYLPEEAVKKSLSYQLNKEWIEQKIREGYTIVDIGEDIERKFPSPFYKMEKQVIKEQYKNANVKIINVNQE